jgi:hypothetical protein
MGGGVGVHIGVLGFEGVRRAVCACNGVLVGCDGVVLASGVTGSVGCC